MVALSTGLSLEMLYGLVQTKSGFLFIKMQHVIHV